MRRPHDALRAYVHRYVGYRIEWGAPGIHRGLPSRRPEFLVRLDEPAAFIAGLRTGPALVPHDGRHNGIAIDLTVRGTRALFGVPAGALTGTVASLDDLVRGCGRRLVERVAERATWEERFRILDETLLASLRPRSEPAPEVLRAWQALTGREPPAIASLAREIGWSRRHLTEMFGREIGLPPRQFLRVLRFERSCRLVRSVPRMTMTEAALRAGYYDHAHMLHEWHRLAGCRPEQWLAEELLSVQAEADRRPLP